jgi:hypothetical protein
MEGPAAGGTEVVPVVIADVEWVCTLLFLVDLNPMDLLFALKADKDSERDSGHGSGNEGSRNGNKNEGSGSEEGGDRPFGAMDGDAMVE